MLFGNNNPPQIKKKLLDAHFRAFEEEQEALKNETTKNYRW
jgi:hypothetical protein